MPSHFVVGWTFSPENALEQTVETKICGYKIRLESGRAEATIDSTDYEEVKKIADEIHASLEALFRGAMIVSNQASKLSEYSISKLHDDGRRDAYLQVKPGSMSLSTFTADVRGVNADGRIVVDTQKDRVERRLRFALRAVRLSPSDSAMKAILSSYSMSISDPSNALVHIYEIVEALQVKFGGKSEAIFELRLSSTKWNMLSRLCNEPMLAEGRHRGKAVGALRSATSNELKAARELASELIERYMDYLEQNRT